MERFTGQELRPKPHIAVLFYDSIGDFVVITPLLRGLRQKYPGGTIDYFSGERTKELEEALPLIDSRFSIYGREGLCPRLSVYIRRRQAAAGPYDLAINCESHKVSSLVTTLLGAKYIVGGCYEPELRREMPRAESRIEAIYDENWADPSFLRRYSDILSSNFIGEVFCRLARVETDFQRTEVPLAAPSIAIPPILIAIGGRRRAKMWPVEYWRELISWCYSQGLEVGLLGARLSEQQRFYHSVLEERCLLEHTPLRDLRGKMTLPQVAGALQQAMACVTIDNGIMHMATAVGTPTLALFGASPWRLWTPQAANLQVVLPEEECCLCAQNHFSNDECLQVRHICMESIQPQVVIGRLEAILGRD